MSESTESRQESSSLDPATLLHFFGVIGRLKSTPRTGWIDRGVPFASVESVADHSFRVAILAWISAPADLDRDRVLKLALIHDLAESITGDLTPYSADELEHPDAHALTAFLNQRHIPPAEWASAKRAAEAAAIAEIISDLPDSLRSEIAGLWRELEARTTLESRFVKQADKLETYLQSLEYAARQPDLAIGSFAAEVDEVVDIPALVQLRDAARRMR